MNTFGRHFRITTAGESHGAALVAIVDGCPAGVALTEADFESDITRRKTGTSRFTSQRKESDQVEILSGVFEGKTTGTPIALLIKNENQKPKDYNTIKDQFRPGHADYTYFKKYGVRDYRGGGRSSARVTVLTVAAGVIAKKILAGKGIEIRGCVTAIGEVEASAMDWSVVEENPFFFPDGEKLPMLETLLTGLRREGDSVGARVYLEALNVPVGLGEPLFAKLDGELAAALMGINAAKAVAIGDGFDVVQQRGSAHRDEMTAAGFLSNHAGGILGGISTGQTITAEVAFKPTSSIRIPGKSVSTSGEEVSVVTTGRHDPCVGFRAVPICEAMMALVLIDAVRAL